MLPAETSIESPTRFSVQKLREDFGSKQLKWLLEATTGIEPVYTVLQTVA
jgi:hypothetical protein